MPLPSAGPRPPWPLVAAVALVGLEAAVLLVLGVLELTVLSSRRAVMGATTTVFFIAYAAALLAGGWLLLRGRSWARAPVVLAQLIQLGVAWSFRGGSTTLVAVAAGVVSVLVLAGIFHPASLAALETPEDEQPG